MQPSGSDSPKVALHAILFVSLLGMAAASYCWFTTIRWMRWTVSTLTILGLGFLLVSLPARSIGQDLRLVEFKSVTKVGNEIVAAIASYSESNEDSPSSLHDLVPTHIEKIPHTGLAAYPEFEYDLNQSRRTWSLSVNVSSGFDKGSLVYFPEQNYPKSWERIGQWAFYPG